MPTSTHCQPTTGPTHQRIQLTDPWDGAHRTEFVVYAPQTRRDPVIAARLAGRGELTFSLGGFTLALRPTATELRAMVEAMVNQADRLDSAPALRAA